MLRQPGGNRFFFTQDRRAGLPELGFVTMLGGGNELAIGRNFHVLERVTCKHRFRDLIADKHAAETLRCRHRLASHIFNCRRVAAKLLDRNTQRFTLTARFFLMLLNARF